MTKDDIKRGDVVYYARIMPTVGIYEVCELLVRSLYDTYFVGVDKRDKHAYLFSYNRINDIVFFDRKVCLQKVLKAEENAPKVSSEKEYEEY